MVAFFNPKLDINRFFIEDSDRPKLALVGEGIGIPGGGNPKLQYHGTSSTTETVDEVIERSDRGNLKIVYSILSIRTFYWQIRK